MPKSDDLIESYLEMNGPALSSVVARYLQMKGMASANSRKAIQRAGPGVFKLGKFRFKHNDQFLYLPSQYRSLTFYQNLLAAFDEKESAYGLAVNSLVARDGLVAKPYFDIISGSPVLMKKQLSSESVLERLTEIGVVEIVNHANLGECVSLTSALRDVPFLLKPRAFWSRLLVEDILLAAVREWIRNLGLGSYNKVQTRDLTSQPQFGQFKWDVCAPSYIHPLTRYNRTSSKVIPGFIVADVLLGQDVTLKHLRYFLKKDGLMRSQRTAAPFLSFFIGERFNKDAFDAGRKAGLVLATTENLFGREVASGLAELIQVLDNAAKSATANPDRIERLFSKLDALKGVEQNVRGPLFELLFARCLDKDGWRISSMNQQIKDPIEGGLAEIDILALRANMLLICECKGYLKNDVTDGEVESWIKTRIPRIRNFLLQQENFRHLEMRFQFCTTSSFKPEALDLLRKHASEVKKYAVEWKERRDLQIFISALRDAHLLKLLQQYYPAT
jgi:Holliday junction resolvase-like predicted endonuclease